MCIVKSDLEEQREGRPGNKAWVATRTSEAEGEFHASLRVGKYLLSHVQHVVSADAPGDLRHTRAPHPTNQQQHG